MLKMDCAACGLSKIGPKIPPFGGHLCDKGHLQCVECNTTSNGICGICKGLNGFVYMSIRDNFEDENTPNSLSATRSCNDDVANEHLEEKVFCNLSSNFAHKAIQATISPGPQQFRQNYAEGEMNDEATNKQHDEFIGKIRSISLKCGSDDACSSETAQSPTQAQGTTQAMIMEAQQAKLFEDKDVVLGLESSLAGRLGTPPLDTPLTTDMNVPQNPLQSPINTKSLEPPNGPDIFFETYRNIKQESILDFETKLSNVHRAFYDTDHQWLGLPPQQFRTVPCCTEMVPELLQVKKYYSSMPLIPTISFTVSRFPVKCPVSSCQFFTFVSDFVKHFEMYHCTLPMYYITPGIYCNLSIDPKLSNVGDSECHLIYLIKNRTTRNGSFKNFLSMAVMSARFNPHHLYKIPHGKHGTLTSDVDTTDEILVIWLTGIMPKEFPIHVALTAWSKASPCVHIRKVSSFELYSIRNSQSVADVIKSAQMLMISSQELKALTDGGKKSLDLQVVVY